MRVLLQLVRKELTVLGRDWHALGLLFVMPLFFIVLMSLALRDVFATGRPAPFTYRLLNYDTTATGRRVAEGVRAHQGFRDLGGIAEDAALDELRREQVHFVVIIPPGFSANMTAAAPHRVRVSMAPGVNPATAQLFAAMLRGVVGQTYARQMLALVPILSGGAGAVLANTDALVEERTVTQASVTVRRPTSVQQNVPAWLVLAMFFVGLPLSTTWLQERSQGTFTKLRSMGLSPTVLLLGKLVPYLLVNLVQVALMLSVGRWVVPALGGDALTMGHSAAGLALIAGATSFAAVSYGLLIANLVSTTEQATILAGVSNLVLGALGGVMVPRSIMPHALQRAALASPMAWGLEGFLDVLLRDGGVRAAGPKALALSGFAIVALLLAGARLRRSGSAHGVRQ